MAQGGYMTDQPGGWMTPGGGIFGDLNAPNQLNSMMGGGGGGSGFRQMIDPFTGQPFSGSMEEYLGRVSQAQNMKNPTNHRQSGGPDMTPDMIRQLTVNRIRANGNDPSQYLARLDAVNNGQTYVPPNNPQQPAGFGFGGTSFRGMGPQGDSMANQLAALMKQPKG